MGLVATFQELAQVNGDMPTGSVLKALAQHFHSKAGLKLLDSLADCGFGLLPPLNETALGGYDAYSFPSFWLVNKDGNEDVFAFRRPLTDAITVRTQKKEQNAAGHDSSSAQAQQQQSQSRQVVYNDFKKVTERTDEEIMMSVGHEGGHHNQWRLALITRASPYNEASKFVLCPRDWALFTALTEACAYAYQGRIASEEAVFNDRLYELTQSDPISAQEFREIQAQCSGNTAQALYEATLRSMKKNWGETNGAQRNFFDHYANDALNQLETSWRFFGFPSGYILPADYKPETVFVRAGKAEMEEIITATFNDVPEIDAGRLLAAFKEKFPFPESIEERIAKLNARLGIIDEDTLPTLRQSLDREGLSNEEYMDRPCQVHSYSQSKAIAGETPPDSTQEYGLAA